MLQNNSFVLQQQMGTLLGWAQVFIFKCYETKIPNGSGSSVVIYAAQEAGKNTCDGVFGTLTQPFRKVTSYSQPSPRGDLEISEEEDPPSHMPFHPGTNNFLNC